MKKLALVAAALVISAGLATQAALAQSGTGGGSGSFIGVTVGCGSVSNTASANFAACGSVTGSATANGGGTQFTLSGPLTLDVVSSNPFAVRDAGLDLSTEGETLDFTLSNVFTSSGGTTSGTFSLSDFSSADADFEIDGNIQSVQVSGSQWILGLVLTTHIYDPTGCECTGAGFGTYPPGVVASMTINFDPGNVVGTSLDLSNAFGGSVATPEPGTLLLLGSGLLGLGPLLRRKIGRA